jgi:hypothetical protein
MGSEFGLQICLVQPMLSLWPGGGQAAHLNCRWSRCEVCKTSRPSWPNFRTLCTESQTWSCIFHVGKFERRTV